ncbi:MAG: right-handed parallel beta-helix repeat-containing protein [Polyangiaceae bacterium]
MNRALLVVLLAAAVGCTQGGSSDPGGDGSGGSDGGSTSTDGGAPQGGGGHDTGTGGDDSGTGGGIPGAPVPVDCTHVGQGTDYQVGPGKAYENIGDVPFESLGAGDTVRIFYRAEPYHEKLMIGGVGTEAQPIRVCGVAGPNGELPIIDGENATTRPQLDFPFTGHQPRGLIIIGHPNSQPYALQPAHITVEALEIRNARSPLTFTDKSGGTMAYSAPAAGIFVQRGDDITVRGCVIHDNNNGLFMGTSGGTDLSHRALIEANYIFDNGSPTDWFEHNVYNEVSDVTYQYNHFGPPKSGAGGVVLGNNIKERSAGVTIRYNWIEDGGHLIDLVDAQEAQSDTVGMPSFHESYVYGNILLRNGTDKGSMVHYGGDSGLYENYRKGTLHFFQNTVIVRNESAGSWNVPAAFELSTNDEQLISTNNVYWAPAAPGSETPVVMLGARDKTISGVASFDHDWIRTGWSPFNQIPGNANVHVAEVAGFPGGLGGTNPGFVDADAGDFSLAAGSPIVGQGTSLAGLPPITQQYVRHQSSRPRADAQPTPGAMMAD